MKDDDLLKNRKGDPSHGAQGLIAESSTSNGWHEARAGLGRIETDGHYGNPALPQPRDAGILRGPSVSAEAGKGNGQVGAFAGAEAFRLSGANSWGQADLALSARTGAKFGSQTEVKVLGTGFEVGKDGIGLSIFGFGFKIKFW